MTRWLVGMVVVANVACASSEPSLDGTILLGEGVDPRGYEALIVRAIRRVDGEDPPTMAPRGPVYVGIEPLIEFDADFPVDVGMVGDELPSSGWLVAWLTDDVSRVWFEADEPHGVMDYLMCECATHTPARADGIEVVIELP